MMMTLSTKDISSGLAGSKPNRLKLRFRDHYLTEYMTYVATKYHGKENLEIGFMTDSSSAIYLDVKRIKFSEDRTVCDVIINCRTKYEKNMVLYYLKREMTLRRMRRYGHAL